MPFSPVEPHLEHGVESSRSPREPSVDIIGTDELRRIIGGSQGCCRPSVLRRRFALADGCCAIMPPPWLIRSVRSRRSTASIVAVTTRCGCRTLRERFPPTSLCCTSARPAGACIRSRHRRVRSPPSSAANQLRWRVLSDATADQCVIARSWGRHPNCLPRHSVRRCADRLAVTD